jgi:hypothetical protein
MRSWKIPLVASLATLLSLTAGCGQEAPFSSSAQELTGTQSTSFQDGVFPTSG